MRFWDWAVAAYARPGVAQACLDLQDAHGQCVPYLLWTAWAAVEGRSLDPAVLTQGAAMSAAWTARTMAPLRAARRAMKAQAPGIDDDAREALRGELKAVELKAERLLMEALEGLTPRSAEAPVVLTAALAVAASAWPADAPREGLARLAFALA